MLVLKDFSRTIGREPVEVYPSLLPMAVSGTAQSTGGLSHLRIWNVSAHTIWLSRSGPAAIGKPGSFPLGPGAREEFEGLQIPLEGLSAVAEAEATLTVELRHLPRVFTTAAGGELTAHHTGSRAGPVLGRRRAERDRPAEDRGGDDAGRSRN